MKRKITHLDLNLIRKSRRLSSLYLYKLRSNILQDTTGIYKHDRLKYDNNFCIIDWKNPVFPRKKKVSPPFEVTCRYIKSPLSELCYIDID